MSKGNVLRISENVLGGIFLDTKWGAMKINEATNQIKQNTSTGV